MMGRCRTHHHVAKQKSEDQSRRPIIAMDYFFMRMESVPNVQAISEESITCVAVKEARHQNIMSRLALKKGVEEPWTIEREVRFIDLLGYREITLKSDRACNSRVQESRSRNVQSGSHHRGCSERRQRIEWAYRERGNAAARNHPNNEVPHREQDAGTTQRWLACHAMVGGARRMHPVKVSESRDGRMPFERLHGKKPTQEFVPFGEKVLARQITTDPRAREIRRLEPQDSWDTEAITNVIGVPWRMTGGRWTVDRPEAQVDPIPIPPLPFGGSRIQRERITRQDINEPGCNAIRDNKRAQAHSDRCSRTTPHGAERLDRRNEVINEALTEGSEKGRAEEEEK